MGFTKETSSPIKRNDSNFQTVLPRFIFVLYHKTKEYQWFPFDMQTRHLDYFKHLQVYLFLCVFSDKRNS